ncbi:putative imidazolonepropionase [Arapaima gigas]
MCVPQLGAELGTLAISHLEEVTDEGIAAMAKSKTAAVLLPTTAYILSKNEDDSRHSGMKHFYPQQKVTHA